MYDLIKRYESFRPQAYRCPAQRWTIGYGTTIYPDGREVKEGDKITESKAEEYLAWYVETNIKPVLKKIPYVLTDNQEKALASLIYNIGSSAFLRSKLFRAIVDKDYEQIFKNWDWIKAGGVVMKGLVKRRTEELYLFMKGI